MGIMLTVLGIDAYFSFKYDLNYFKLSLKENLKFSCTTIGIAASDIFQISGNSGVETLVKQINNEKNGLTIQWFDSTQYPSIISSHRNISTLLNQIDSLTLWHVFEEYDSNRKKFFSVYFPLVSNTKIAGIMQISKPINAIHDYLIKTLVHLCIVSATLMIISFIFILGIGSSLITKPLQILSNKVKDIGKGNLASRIDLPHHLEFTQLAHALNQMCDDLNLARISIQNETQKRLELFEQLKHAERLTTLGYVSSGIAHELGTPLNVISGRAKLIAAEKLYSSDIHENATIIQSQADKMTKTIRTFLNYARRPQTKKEIVALDELVLSTITFLKPTMTKAQCYCETIICSDNLPHIEVDSIEIQQVFTNIFINAMDAMPAGGKIHISFGQETITPMRTVFLKKVKCIVVSIADEGIGMKSDIIDQIFNPFFTTKDTGKGTGLGLSIAQDIMKDHKGWITVVSQPNKGSSFTLYFPYAET